MSFFRRRGSGLGSFTDVAGMADAAAAWGWQPASDQPFDARVESALHRVVRTLHDAPPAPFDAGRAGLGLGRTSFRDAYRGVVDGRSVTIANAWVDIEAVALAGRHLYGSAVCGVELSTMLPLGIEPRGRHQALKGIEVSAADPAFDAAYHVVGVPQTRDVVTPEMQQRIMARDGWAFFTHEALLVCVDRDPFESAEEVSERVQDVLGVIAALPSTVEAAQVDHSLDDLLARIDQLDSVDDAVAFLEQLSDADRQRLAQSPTPLARFADVRTPDEVMTRFMSLDQNEQMQIMAMFDKVRGD